MYIWMSGYTNAFDYITLNDVRKFKAEMNKSFPVSSLCILQIALCVSVHTSDVHYVQPAHSSTAHYQQLPLTVCNTISDLPKHGNNP